MFVAFIYIFYGLHAMVERQTLGDITSQDLSKRMPKPVTIPEENKINAKPPRILEKVLFQIR